MGSSNDLAIVAALVVGIVAWRAGLLNGVISQLKDLTGGLLPGSGGGGSGGGGTSSGGGGAVSGSSGACGTHIYKEAGAAKSGGPGKNQNIHYSSTGKAAISHRVDIQGTPQDALEATIYLTMPASCSDGGKNGIGIKFYGPNHTDSSCCYCLAGLGVSGNISFGGEGPHPSTASTQASGGSAGGTVGGKKVGFKHIIYKKGATIHQEAWIDTNGTWRKTGQYDRSSCGKTKTSTSPAANAEVEFRSDCANVVFHCTEVVPIVAGQLKSGGASPNVPTGKGGGGASYLGFAGPDEGQNEFMDECFDADEPMQPNIFPTKQLWGYAANVTAFAHDPDDDYYDLHPATVYPIDYYKSRRRLYQQKRIIPFVKSFG